MSLLRRLFGHGNKGPKDDSDAELTSWLADERLKFRNALKDAVRSHVERLHSQYDDVYGYAILADEPYELRWLVPIFNRESDLKEHSTYYRFCVDEWENRDEDSFSGLTPLIANFNEQFRCLHPEDPDDFEMDQYEISHITRFHEAILAALRELVNEGVFGPEADKRFLAIWLSDSHHDIIFRSVRQLNAPAVAGQFLEEFGE